LLNKIQEQKQQIESLTKTIESLEANQEKQIQSLNEKIVALEAKLD
jgi:uncharacterized coiled-coil protein SlyX